jgi:hypothetical protein
MRRRGKGRSFECAALPRNIAATFSNVLEAKERGLAENLLEYIAPECTHVELLPRVEAG